MRGLLKILLVIIGVSAGVSLAPKAFADDNNTNDDPVFRALARMLDPGLVAPGVVKVTLPVVARAHMKSIPLDARDQLVDTNRLRRQVLSIHLGLDETTHQAPLTEGTKLMTTRMLYALAGSPSLHEILDPVRQSIASAVPLGSVTRTEPSLFISANLNPPKSHGTGSVTIYLPGEKDATSNGVRSLQIDYAVHRAAKAPQLVPTLVSYYDSANPIPVRVEIPKEVRPELARKIAEHSSTLRERKR